MPSPQLQWALDRIAADRAAAGVSPDRFDAVAARASLPPTLLPDPERTRIVPVAIGAVPAWWVIAAGADTTRRIVHFHGGGFITGGFHSHRTLASWLSHAAKAAVLVPDYRLAPENRFPAGLDDCEAAARHAAANGPDGRSAAQTLYLSGDSAGGSLAVGVLLRLRAAGLPMPAACAIQCGMLDLDETTSKFVASARRTRDGVRLYVDRLADLSNPQANVMLADLTDLPPMLVQTGSADYCADECARFAARARACGVAVTFETWPDMIHVWHRFAPELPEAVDALACVARFLGSPATYTTERHAA